MTNQEILTKAIEKAIAGGWGVDLEVVLPVMEKKWSLYGLKYTGYSGLLFSKDFAKALWGVKKYDNQRNYETKEILPEYLYYLQQMVIAEDPIKYLGEHV